RVFDRGIAHALAVAGVDEHHRLEQQRLRPAERVVEAEEHRTDGVSAVAVQRDYPATAFEGFAPLPDFFRTPRRAVFVEDVEHATSFFDGSGISSFSSLMLTVSAVPFEVVLSGTGTISASSGHSS